MPWGAPLVVVTESVLLVGDAGAPVRPGQASTESQHEGAMGSQASSSCGMMGMMVEDDDEGLPCTTPASTNPTLSQQNQHTTQQHTPRPLHLARKARASWRACPLL